MAKVDLSKDFESGGGSLSLSLRLAQVTCTLDQFDSVSGVRFLLDGDLVNVFSGNGIVLDQPVGCADYAEFVDGAPPATATFPGIWPFTSQAEMDDYLSGADRTFTSPGRRRPRRSASATWGWSSPAAFGSPTPVAGGRVEVKLGFTIGEGGVPDRRPPADDERVPPVRRGRRRPGPVDGGGGDVAPDRGAPTRRPSTGSRRR